MTTDYTALDRAIVQAIAQGKSTANDIQRAIEPRVHTLLQSEARLAAVIHTLWRTIDRRLQALRKRGDIVFCRATRTWGIVSHG